MRQKDIYRASIFLAVIGLTLVYAASLYMTVEKVDIGEIERSWNGRNVKVSGTVADFHRSGDISFIDLEDATGEILVVDFDSSLELDEGDRLNVTGHVSIYEGELEVIAREVER